MLRRMFLAGWAGALAAADSLFDGRSLAGWRNPLPEIPVEGCWRARKGTLEAIPTDEVPGGLASDIWTVRTFRAFDLSFEFLAAPAANSGVKFQIVRALYVEQYRDEERVLPSYAARRSGARVLAYTQALEYQVADVAEPDGLIRATSRAGALYGKVAPPGDVRPKSGKWNRGRVRLAPDGRLEFWLNGRRTVETTVPTPLRSSAIALQHHATRVAFRGLRVTAL
jgi:hypothetical protein